MITVKVVSDDGWQNGDELIPKGQLRELECDEDRVKAYVDNGVLEIVRPAVKIEAEDPNKKMQEIIDASVATAVKLLQKSDPETAKIKVIDRVEDDPKGGFNCLADFAHKIWKADQPGGNKSSTAAKQIHEWDKRAVQLKTTGHMAEEDPEQGGHLVPVGFVDSLLQRSLESAIVRPRAMFVPCATNSIAFPALVDYDHRPAGDGIFGAVKIKRPGEAEQKDPSKPEFEKIQLTLHKIVALTYVSDELLEDSPISIEPLLTNLFGQAIAWHEDKSVVPCRRKAA